MQQHKMSKSKPTATKHFFKKVYVNKLKDNKHGCYPNNIMHDPLVTQIRSVLSQV